MAQQIKRDRGVCGETDENLMEAQCKICYLQLDGGHHYPMMVCSSQHILCHACFLHLSKNTQFLQCPFCKRTTDVDNVIKFRYALNASAKYRELKEKYLRLLDRINNQCGMKEDKEYGQILTELQKNVDFLKNKLKISEDHNKVLLEEMQHQRHKYSMFEREVIECKHNDILIKNKLTMVEYQLSMLEKENNSLSGKLANAKVQLQICGNTIKQLKGSNELLRQQMAKLTERGRNEMKAEGQVKNQGNDECPQMEGEGSNLSQRLFLANKKSKSQYRIKTEMPIPSSMTKIQTNTPKTKKGPFARKSEKNKTKEKDENMKFMEKKIQKFFKF